MVIFSLYGTNSYLNELINTVILQTDEQRIEITKPASQFWSRFCKKDRTDICIPLEYPDITALKVLERFIQNYPTELKFTNASVLFKKYLKYKNKYLSIKNNI